MHGSQMMYAILFMIAHGWALPGQEVFARNAGCDPVLTALFTPPRPQLGWYEVCTDPAPLDRAIAAGTADGLQFGTIESLEPADAFGAAGPYDRFALTRLYGGQRVHVSRGWRWRGAVFESVTALSPYPDASLTRLVDGTMTIRWQLER